MSVKNIQSIERKWSVFDIYCGPIVSIGIVFGLGGITGIGWLLFKYWELIEEYFTSFMSFALWMVVGVIALMFVVAGLRDVCMLGYKYVSFLHRQLYIPLTKEEIKSVCNGTLNYKDYFKYLLEFTHGFSIQNNKKVWKSFLETTADIFSSEFAELYANFMIEEHRITKGKRNSFIIEGQVRREYLSMLKTYKKQQKAHSFKIGDCNFVSYSWTYWIIGHMWILLSITLFVVGLSALYISQIVPIDHQWLYFGLFGGLVVYICMCALTMRRAEIFIL